MVRPNPSRCGFIFTLLVSATAVSAQQVGGIRGMVYDKDFEAPLPGAQVSIAETGETVTTTDEGNYVFREVAPGTYTLVFHKEGFARQIKSDVVVAAGQMTEVDVWMSGEFTEMEEFIVQDVQFDGGTEAELLQIRMESPALMDSISFDLMSQAGAGDAASALKLVPGASIQDGKYAVIRGLPDRYVNSQMNGVRLPTADADKRAVQLDQFPSAAIESIQVSKTFTPDQQGDASGGAVNVILKGIPEERFFKLSGQLGYRPDVTGNDDYLSYDGGGVGFWGNETRDPQTNRIGENWTGAVGVSRHDAPGDYKWSFATGGKHAISKLFRVGGFGSFFYEQDSSFFDNGIDDKYWVEDPGDPMTPQYGSNERPNQANFKTSLFDVTQGSEQVQWGTLVTLGVETDNHTLTLVNLYTRTAEDVATLAEDTRGKKSLHKFWPQWYGTDFEDYDPNDPNHPGNQEREAAPFLRTETLEYTERTTRTHQLNGTHELPDPGMQVNSVFTSLNPEIDWRLSRSAAGLYQPDKRQFGSLWWGESYNPGYPPHVPPFTSPEVHRPFKPAASHYIGNFQRIWKDISEDSDQYSLNVKFPFEQWSHDEGFLKLGVFDDTVSREYRQDSFSNFGDNSDRVEPAPWEDFWSRTYLSEDHPIFPSDTDVDYDGDQDISAWYYMLDVPLCSYLNIIGGYRFEKTELVIVNDADRHAFWNPPGRGSTEVTPGFYPDGADAQFEQDDVLPAIALEYTPLEKLKMRASYSETVARQTFKELTPIQQMDYLGGDVFVGYPGLKMSALKNYDLRCDYTPYEGGLISLSYFHKEIQDPIEYVQRYGDFTYTTPRNYPEGELSGYEIEVRQKMDRFWDRFEGLSIGANATFIDSEVTLPKEESESFSAPNIMAPMSKRDMHNAPEHLYNFFVLQDLGKMGSLDLTGTRLGVFYNVRGDTLVAGAGQSKGKFVPSVYEKEYGTLNMSVARDIGERGKMKFQAKNLLDPDIETVYRSEYIEDDVTKTSYRKGMEFTVSLSVEL